MTYTAETRQEIVTAHMAAHGGSYKPDEFLAVASSSDHPAHAYFDWDDSEAARKHRLWQARQFVKFKRLDVVEVHHDLTGEKSEIRYTMPANVSPMDSRQTDDGGYISTATPDGRKELRKEALRDGHGLQAWLNRYEAILMPDEAKLAKALIKKLQR